jgi:hypothetical protein
VEAEARLRLLACPTAGDILLVANYAAGYYFGGVTVGTHGGLHPEEYLAVASLGWPGCTAEQWAGLRNLAASVVAQRRSAEGRTQASVTDTMPVLLQAMGWD